jgi:proton-dependent oligopeptide transporter, POT family
MVGGLYAQGDPRRDKGFTIFYIGINIGAFFASVIVGLVGEKIGWHYGFGLAGIGMLIGQIVFIMGQKHLKGIGDYVAPVKIEGTNKNRPLTKIEKDRIFVLLVSFIIVIVFWGAFEQAGGLMNIYAKEKIDRTLFNWEIPASVFQSLNPLFIMIFGTAVAGFWVFWQRKRKESSAIFKMAVGTMIMGTGFMVMSFASLDASSESFGKAGMIWLVLAYLLHTIGELCASPVALSFITKLAPVKYASIMMGVYFATTGFGNFLAGKIGEATQTEPIEVEVKNWGMLSDHVNDTIIEKNYDFSVMAEVFPKHQEGFEMVALTNRHSINDVFQIKNPEHFKEVVEQFEDHEKLHATFKFVFDFDNSNAYQGILIIEEWNNKKEFKTFVLIFIFTLVFGIVLLVFLKPLKRLTHGAEDINEEEKY